VTPQLRLLEQFYRRYTVGKENPIAYCSRQLNSAETTELELLAFLFATKQFRCYLYGRKFTVYTDQRAL